MAKLSFHRRRWVVVILALVLSAQPIIIAPAETVSGQIIYSPALERSLGGVCINEFLPAPRYVDWDGDGNATSSDEWIELYNSLPYSMALVGWSIADGSTSYALDGLTIPAEGFLVLYRMDTGIVLGNSGDTLTLYNGTDVVDTYTYTTTSYDRSYGRRWDGEVWWSFLNTPTPGGSNNPPNVVINEFSPNPVGSDRDGGEWVELYNGGPRAVELSYWYLSDQDGEFDYFFPSDSFLNVSEYALVVFDSIAPAAVPPGTKVYLAEAREVMDNKGDDLVLYDRGDVPVDYVAYGNSTRIDPPPGPMTWDGVWYNFSTDSYVSGGVGVNPAVKEEGDVVRRVPNGWDSDSVSDLNVTNYKGATPGRNNENIYYVEMDIDPTTAMLMTGESRVITGTLWNLGNVPDSYELTTALDGNGWGVDVAYDNSTLAPGEGRDFSITLTAPLIGQGRYYLDCYVNVTSTALSFITSSETLHVYTTPGAYITEMYYDPPGADTVAGEWIEIYNANTKALDLNGWVLDDGDGTEVELGGTVEGGGYALITTLTSESCGINYSQYNVTAIFLGDGGGGPFLTSSGDDLTLLDPMGYAVDYVSYGNSSYVDPPPEWLKEYYMSIAHSYHINVTGDDYPGIGRNVSLVDNGTVELGPWHGVEWDNRTLGWSNTDIVRMELEVPDEVFMGLNTTAKINISAYNKGIRDEYVSIDLHLSNPNWTAWVEDGDDGARGEGGGGVVMLPANKGVGLSFYVRSPARAVMGCTCDLDIELRSLHVPYMTSARAKVTVPNGDPGIVGLEVGRVMDPEATPMTPETYWPNICGEFEAYVGERLELGVGVKNHGTAPIDGTFQVQVRFLPMGGGNISSISIDNATVLSTTDIKGLGKGLSRTVTFTIDTLQLSTSGYVFVLCDPANNLEEENEGDNVVVFYLALSPMEYIGNIYRVKITEVSPGGYLDGDSDEFVIIKNTGPDDIDLGGWYISDMEGTLTFPSPTPLAEGMEIAICRDRGSYTLLRPDFQGSIVAMDDMVESGSFALSQKGDSVLLFDRYWRDVDAVFYGKDDEMVGYGGWVGNSTAPLLPYHTITRSGDEDTNSSADFSPLRYSPLAPLPSHILSAAYKFTSLSYITHPDAGLDPLISIIDNATESIAVITYVLTSPAIVASLMRALERGVSVDVYVEGRPVGGMGETEAVYLNALSRKGAGVYLYDSSENEMYRYMHAKFIILDGREVWVSTENLVTGAYNDGTWGNRGLSVMLFGAEGLAEGLMAVIQHDMALGMIEDLRESEAYDMGGGNVSLSTVNATGLYKPIFQEGFINTTGTAALVVSPDTLSHHNDPLMQAISGAKGTIDMWAHIAQMNATIGGVLLSNPYLSAIMDKARMGVRVRIILDVRYTSFPNGTNLAFARTLLDWAERMGCGNVTIGLMGTPGINCTHSKAMVIDGYYTYIGSMNQDLNSMYRNREVGVLISSEGLGAWVVGVFNYDWAHAVRLNLSDLKTLRNTSYDDLKIVRVYYDGYMPFDPEEFVAIYNSGHGAIELSGFEITDWDGGGGDNCAVLFPQGTSISPAQTLYVARDAEAFRKVMGFYPDFYYLPTSHYNVSRRMIVLDASAKDENRGIYLSNSGDNVLLGDRYLFLAPLSPSHLIDAVYYGNFTPTRVMGWEGQFIPDLPSGRVLWRCMADGTPQDTQTLNDWDLIVSHRPGQSSFAPAHIVCRNVTAFSTPFNALPYIIAVIDSALLSIEINVYELSSVPIGSALLRALNRGVKVSILVEGQPVGGLGDYSLSILHILREAGADVRVLYSKSSEGIYPRVDYDHAKYIIVDSKVAVILSDNLVPSSMPEYAGLVTDMNYILGGSRGWGVAIESRDLAKALHEVYSWDCNPVMTDAITLERFMAIRGIDGSTLPLTPSDLSASEVGRGYVPEEMNTTPLSVRNRSCGASLIMAPDNALSRNNALFKAINGAKSEILVELMRLEPIWTIQYDNYNVTMVNPYLKAVMDAAERGVSLKILLDGGLVTYDDTNLEAMRFIQEYALERGLGDRVEVRLHHPDDLIPLVHNKGVIVDGKVVAVSSINWVRASPTSNREIGVVINSSVVGGYFRQGFMADWNRSYLNNVDISVSGNRTRMIPEGEETLIFLTFTNMQTGRLTVSINATEGAWATVRFNVSSLTIGPNGTGVVEMHVASDKGARGRDGIDVYVTIKGHRAFAEHIEILYTQAKSTGVGGGDKGGGPMGYIMPRYVTQIMYVAILSVAVALIALSRDALRALKPSNRGNGGGGKGDVPSDGQPNDNCQGVKKRDINKSLEGGRRRKSKRKSGGRQGDDEKAEGKR